MKSRILAVVALALTLAASAIADSKPADRPLTVGICASPKQFEPLGKYLGENFRVVVVRIDSDADNTIPDAAKIAGCDVVLLNHYRTKPSAEQLKAIQDYYRAGKPVVGTRKASHAYSDWLQIDKEVFGAKYGGHFFEQKKEQTVFFDAAGKEHPLVKGVEPRMCGGGLYNYTELAPDVMVLMSGGPPGKSMPVTWTRVNKERNNQRVFYTRYDPKDTADNADIRDMLIRALFWAADKDIEKYRKK